MARSIEVVPDRVEVEAWGKEKGDTGPDTGKPNSAESITTDDAGTVDDIVQDQPSALPFSKARCIALVATVAGASFLNVSRCPLKSFEFGTDTYLQTVSGQAVVIVLPTIGRHLDIPDSRLQWVVSAYNLAFGCFLLLWGRIADIYGKRKIFIWGSAWVAVTTVINPFLPNEIAFDLFRGLQGLVCLAYALLGKQRHRLTCISIRGRRRTYLQPLVFWEPRSPQGRQRTMPLAAMVCFTTACLLSHNN